MSLETTGRPLAARPEATQPFPEIAANPAEVFHNHVAAVRAEGDALDIQHRLHIRSALQSGALVGGVVGVLAEASVEAGTLNPPVNAAAIAVGGLVLYSKFIRAPRDRRVGEQRFNTAAQQATGQRYELYRHAEHARSPKHPAAKPDKLTVQWHAPMHQTHDTDHLEQLTRMARMARTEGVDNMAVNEAVARPIMPELDDPNAKLKDLYRKKSLRTGGKTSQDPLHIKTPDEWLTLAEKQRAREGYSLEVMIGKIEKHWNNPQYDHPLVTTHRLYKGTDQHRERLLHTARKGVERQLDDVEGGRDIYGTRTRTYIRGTLDTRGNVQQFMNGAFGGTTTLDRALGQTNEQLLKAVDEATADPQAAIRALEVLTYKHAKKMPVTLPRGEAADEPDPHTIPKSPSRQPQFTRKEKMNKAERIRTRLRRTARAVGFVAAAATFTALSYAASDKLSTAYTNDHQAAHDQLQKDRGKDAAVDYADPAIEARLKHKWGVYQKVESGVYSLTAQLDHGPLSVRDKSLADIPVPQNHLNTNNASSRWPSIQMGDVKRDENRTEWSVQQVGMEAGGYWAANVSDQLSITGYIKDYGVDIQWDRNDSDNLFSHDLHLPATRPAAVTQYLDVSRNLSYGDVQYTNYSEAYTLALPVRESTIPVAASLNGQPIKVMQRADGTFFAAITPIQKDKLLNNDLGGSFNYTLTSSADAPEPHPPYGVDIGGWDDTFSAKSVDRAWEAILPNLPKDDGTPATAAKRTQMIGSYIQSHWNYAVTPFGDDGLQGVRTLEQEIAWVNTNGKANCNVANGLVDIENPEYAPVSGYLNSGDTSKLSSHEAHEWSADAKGKRTDYTPSGGMSAEDEQFFAENYDKAPPEPHIGWFYAQIGLLAAGVGAWRRRDIIKAVNTARDGAAAADQHTFALGSAAKARLATSLAEQVTYAPRVDISAARTRASADNRSKKTLAARLQRPNAGLHSKQTSKDLRLAARNADSRADRKALRTAARMVSRARRIARRQAAKQARKKK